MIVSHTYLIQSVFGENVSNSAAVTLALLSRSVDASHPYESNPREHLFIFGTQFLFDSYPAVATLCFILKSSLPLSISQKHWEDGCVFTPCEVQRFTVSQ